MAGSGWEGTHCQAWVDTRYRIFLVVASSSRSQVEAWTASGASSLTWERPSVSVRWRPPPSASIVTQLVTRVYRIMIIRFVGIWMRTTGARQGRGTSSAARSRCLRSYMRAVGCPCFCTSCCTKLTLSCQCGGLKVLLHGPKSGRPGPSSPCGDTRSKASVPLFKEVSIPIWDARESALETATLLYGDRRLIVSLPEGRLPVSPVHYLAPTQGSSHAYRAASPKDENPWPY